VFGFDVTGPAGSNVVIQASTNLQNWIPLQTTLLGSGPLHFTDSLPPGNAQRFSDLLPIGALSSAVKCQGFFNHLRVISGSLQIQPFL
jgi:hypothetical protein